MSEKYSETQKRISKESLFTSLILLLETKEFNQINISEITKKAGVSRPAFYRNYQSKEAIIIDYLKELFDQLIFQIEQEKSQSKRERTHLFFIFFRTHRQMFQTFIKAKLSFLIYDVFLEYMDLFFRTQTTKIAKSDIQQKYFTSYIASGLFSVLIQWIESNCQESEVAMTNFIMSLSD